MAATVYLFHYIPLGWQTRSCTLSQLSQMQNVGDNPAPCEPEPTSAATFLVRFLVEIVACLLVLWDCTSQSNQLMGYQVYESKLGMAYLAEAVYLHSFMGLFLFRAFLWSIMVICVTVVYQHAPKSVSVFPEWISTPTPYYIGGGITLACTVIHRFISK
eukprot:749221_1